MPGLFAAGDVRHNSVKRCATAVGEGATAVSMVHRFLALESRPKSLPLGLRTHQYFQPGREPAHALVERQSHPKKEMKECVQFRSRRLGIQPTSSN